MNDVTAPERCVHRTVICKQEDENKRFIMETVNGDCLEKAGLVIPWEGKAIIDKNTALKVGDLVYCTKIAGQLGGYIKQVKEIGEDVLVGTAYLDESRDFTFLAAEILGVVKEVYCKARGCRVYVRGESNGQSN